MDNVKPLGDQPFTSSIYGLITLNVILLLLQCWVYYRSGLHQLPTTSLGHDPSHSTNLMDLPPEVRALIWKEVVSAERRRPATASSKEKAAAPSSLLASATTILTQSFTKPPINSIISLLRTSKTIHEEALQVVCLYSPVNLNIDPDHTDNQQGGTLFHASKSFLAQIRRAHITLSITPASILPFQKNMQALEWRNLATSSQWSRKASILTQLASMEKLSTLHLTVIATGNVHANPVWLWHYVCEALLVPLREGNLIDVKCQISFQIEQMPVLRPNGLMKGEFVARNGDQRMGWGFICRNGHEVFGYECAAGVREFARGLVGGCDVEGCLYRELR